MQHSADLLTSLSELTYGPSEIYSDTSKPEAAYRSLRRSLLKKYRPPKGNPAADSVALNKFIACNDACRNFSLRQTRLYDDMVDGEVCASFDRLAFDGPDLRFSSDALGRRMALGSGMNVGSTTENFYSKLFDSTLTYTHSESIHLLRWATRYDARWIDAIMTTWHQRGALRVRGSNLSFAVKNSDESRTICTEPVLQMLFQLAAGAIIEEALLREFRIDLSRQPALNAELARVGSIDGAFGTIDLTSASDMMALTLCKAKMPDYLYRLFLKLRSPETKLPNGQWIKLEMMSSMGNGFTFPLQTYLFASVVMACYRVLGLKAKYRRGTPANFGVFGDDIVVEKSAYEFVTWTLERYGFLVNRAKSFNSGPFRESCGKDYFNGHDIRGVYLKDLQHVHHYFSLHNRLAAYNNRHLNCEMVNAVLRSIREAIPTYLRFEVDPRRYTAVDSCFAAGYGYMCGAPDIETAKRAAGDLTKDLAAYVNGIRARGGIKRRSGLARVKLFGAWYYARDVIKLYAWYAQWAQLGPKSDNSRCFSNTAKLCGWHAELRTARRILHGSYPVLVRRSVRQDVVSNVKGGRPTGYLRNDAGLHLAFLGGFVDSSGLATLREKDVAPSYKVVFVKDFYDKNPRLEFSESTAGGWYLRW